MAIVEMSKIKLIGMTYHKEEILNALHKTGSVQIIATSEMENTKIVLNQEEREELSRKYERTKSCIDVITDNVAKIKDVGISEDEKNSLKNFFVSYEEFMSIDKDENGLISVMETVEELSKKSQTNNADKIRLVNLKSQLSAYSDLKYKLNEFTDTKYTKNYFGTIKKDNLQKLKENLSGLKYTDLTVLVDAPLSVISVVSFLDEADGVVETLTELGFTACPFNFNFTAKEKQNEIDNTVNGLDKENLEISEQIRSFVKDLRKLKILADFYKFSLEKHLDTENFRCTGETFILEGYIPKDRQEEIISAVNQVSDAVFVEFKEPEKGDKPPTLLKNNRIIRQSEFVTDMYSVPNYREIDPNRIVFFFFMLFMGLIMADVGYGVLMICIGLLLARRIKVDNGTRRLWNVIAIGGVFAILFGALFNSYFGVKLPYKALLPDPIPTAESGMDNLMTILLLCLGLGVFQIAVGYLYKAINSFKQGDVSDGIFDGLIWVIFFIGLIFAGFNFIFSYLMSDTYVMNEKVHSFFESVKLPGIIMLIGAVAVAALTAGRKEKGFGKFSKGFGAVYGLINLMSDILSYARLFGLMLSGMIIASTFNDLGLGIISNGAIGYVLGPIVIVVGHVFNIAMGVLGAYIHDSRLQYIEFFGKFYTGEGESFAPIGSKLDYVYLTK